MPKNQDNSQLLADMAKMAAWAEHEDKSKFPKTYQPIPEHVRAFDPSVILVIGPRGSGKSELFRAVIQLNLMPAIQRCLPEVGLPFKELDRITWIAAYPSQRNFPGTLELARFIHDEYPNPENPPMEIWYAYLVRFLWDHLVPEDQEVLRKLKEIDGGAVDEIHKAFKSLKNAPQLALDHLDEKLEMEDRYIFVGYDELDLIGGTDWAAMSQAISGLVAFWAAYTRRWRRVRAKIFLRTDLFSRYAKEGGPDLAKLAANRVELYWSDKSLYAVLLKRIANQSEDLWGYVEVTRGIKFVNDPDLGHVPIIKKSEDVKPLIKRMVGEYMGATPKKGYTHRWLLNHIRDGRGQALPRPMVRIIAFAADVQKNSQRKVSMPKIVDHISLRRALDRVSEEHVNFSRSEWPWLDKLRESVKDLQVPLERDVLVERMHKNIYNNNNELKSILPTDNAEDLTDYLVEVGIFRERSGKKIDVPDLFLSGLGLKRKGGVRKK